MALTDLARRVCRLLADRRVAGGERYVAGGLALNEVLEGARRSDDLDLFHDAEEAVAVSFAQDRELLVAHGLTVEPLRELRGFVEVLVRDPGGEALLVQWVRDSAFRFYPLVEHPVLGLTLHPFDLATNKVLALVGRVEPRDWVDILTCHERLTPLGCLAWAASGKDPGLGPRFVLDEAARTARYSAGEILALSFAGPPPDPAALARAWHAALAEARTMIALLPPDHVGTAVLERGAPFRGDPGELRAALEAGRLEFHPGRLGGALPEVRPA